MTEQERAQLEGLAADIRMRAAALPPESPWRGWMLRRAATCDTMTGMPATRPALRVIRTAYEHLKDAAEDRAASGSMLIGAMAGTFLLSMIF